MKTYILKQRNADGPLSVYLYDGTTRLSDEQLTTLFATTGSAYFVFDFDGHTITDKTAFSILNSSDVGIMSATGLTGVQEDRNFKGVWADSATAFTSFTLLKGVAMDEAELTTLVGMVKNAGGIKTLTTADYNYPTTGTKTSIAMWLLDAGIYKIGEASTVVSVLYNQTVTMNSDSVFYIFKDRSASLGYKGILYWGTANEGIRIVLTDNSGAPYRLENLGDDTIMQGYHTVDNLTNASPRRPLSAAQGKYLNDKIEGRLKTNAGAPTTSTTGTKGQLLEDTTNGNLYICTNSASPYAWKQIDKDEILTNAGAPTTSTAGTLGQLLTDTTNAKLYQLTAIDNTDPQNPSYTWTEVGGGSGPTVVQTTGTSTTDVMSQNAVTGMVFADQITKNQIHIGHSAVVLGQNAIAIGRQASAMPGALAIGAYANAGATYSVALGRNATTTVQGQFDIGVGTSGIGYNNSNYRLLTGLYDPQTAHDAVNKQYVDGLALGTTESVTIADTDWSALSSSDPYTYSATVSVTATIGANSTVSLINDAAVDFATYGFAIGSVDQPNNTVTVYSIGSPSSSVNLKINVKGA